MILCGGSKGLIIAILNKDKMNADEIAEWANDLGSPLQERITCEVIRTHDQVGTYMTTKHEQLLATSRSPFFTSRIACNAKFYQCIRMTVQKNLQTLSAPFRDLNRPYHLHAGYKIHKPSAHTNQNKIPDPMPHAI